MYVEFFTNISMVTLLSLLLRLTSQTMKVADFKPDIEKICAYFGIIVGADLFFTET